MSGVIEHRTIRAREHGPLAPINRNFAFLAGLGMLAMMLVGTADVIGGNVFRRPIPAAFEFIATIMVVVVFFSVGLAQARRAHIRVEIVVNLCPPKVRRVADIFQNIATFMFIALIAWYGCRSGLRSYTQGEYVSGLINWPLYPARFALALGATLMAAQCLYSAALGVWALATNRPSPEQVDPSQ